MDDEHRPIRPAEPGPANQAAGRDASLGEAWTQAKSTRAAPDAEPNEFASDPPESRSTAEQDGEPHTPAYAELPSTARYGTSPTED